MNLKKLARWKWNHRASSRIFAVFLSVYDLNPAAACCAAGFFDRLRRRPFRDAAFSFLLGPVRREKASSLTAYRGRKVGKFVYSAFIFTENIAISGKNDMILGVEKFSNLKAKDLIP
ncbi:hypothetical protein SDC9_99731 [bioreactor metagenome]|uniref:Uncharacterized protein n=1 Tax=bioreactor metagenome TaxID=1076179 RepID=A0A645AIW5_9ZZZZ